MKTSSSPTMLKEFVKLFVPVALLLVLGIVAIDQTRRYALVRDIIGREAALVRQESRVFTTLLASHLSDTVFLARVVAYHLDTHNPQELAIRHLKPILLAVAQQRQNYHQVRYLDLRGREAIRVNLEDGLARVVASGELQDKSDRDYFERAAPLPTGRVYISRFDLNIEDGKVEVPYRPTLRFASAVFDGSGRKRGVVVLNFMGARLLSHLRNASAISRGYLLMANREGYWLIGPGTDQEWGFLLSARAESRMSKRFPEAWPRLAKAEKGQFRTERGLFTFQNLGVDHVSDALSGVLRGVTGDEVFRIISWVPPDALAPGGRSWLLVGVMAILSGVAVFFWLWARVRVRNAQAEDELRESEETMAAVGDSVQDAIIMVGAGDRVAFWNPAAERMFGYSLQEMQSKPMHALLAGPDDAKKAHEALEIFYRTGKGPLLGTVREVEGRRRDQSTVPLELALSSVRLRGEWLGVASIRDITERKRYEAQLQHLATTDPLTGLANRRHFMDLANQAFSQAKRYGHPLSVIMIDVDHFKKVNDTYGHAAGDEVLRELAKVGTAALREVDVLGRLGGEEFAALLPETDEAGAVEVAERMRTAFAQNEVATDQGTIYYTVSLGVAALAPAVSRVDDLINNSDAALYQAKEGGRNRVEVFSNETPDKV